MAKELEITLVRSIIGRPEKQRLVVKGLGLKKLHKTVRRPDTDAVRGMIEKVCHLVEVKEI